MAHVAVLDDDQAVLDSLLMRLSAEGYQSSGYLDPETFLADAPLAAIDCCLVDIQLPKISGTQVLRQALKRDPDLPVLIISGHGDIEDAVYAVKQGAAGYLEKPINGEKLMREIRQSVAKRAHARTQKTEAANHRERIGTLTPREREVFDEMLLGHANKVIAHSLGCSQRTVEIHRSRVMSKTQAKSLADLVHIAHLADI